MAKLLLIVCALIAFGAVAAQAQTTPASSPAAPAQSPATADPQSPPAARLIKPRPGHVDSHPVDRAAHRPLDEKCKPLKDQLEVELQKNGNQHRLFQARLAHNAGTRFCREGHADKGIAEFQRGLSYLQVAPH